MALSSTPTHLLPSHLVMTADEYIVFARRVGRYGIVYTSTLTEAGIPESEMLRAVAGGFARVESVYVANLSTKYRMFFV